MRDFRDAKAMAQTLREALKPKSVYLTHSESLEFVAKMLGFHDWNELSAKIQSESEPAAAKPATTIPSPPALSIGARADLPAVAMRDVVLFPRMILPLFVGRDTTKRAIERAMAEDRRVLAITQRRSADDNPRRADLYDVGVIASVIDLINLGDGTIKLLVKGLQRVAVAQLIEGPFLAAEVVGVGETRESDEEALVLSRTVVEESRPVARAISRPRRTACSAFRRTRASWQTRLLPCLSARSARSRSSLETSDVVARLQKVLALMKADQQAA
jgi:ATP-dependent Lon protease